MQKEPTDPSTYINPLPLPPKDYKSLSDLPVVKYGCDSLYAIDPRFKHLATDYSSAADLVEKAIKPLLYDGEWIHPVTDNRIELCFTGGEPMMQQQALIDIMKEVDVIGNSIKVQIETNATKPLDKKFVEYVIAEQPNIHFNMSPKLWHVSGEGDAVNYHIIKAYHDLTKSSILKFVINNDDEAWDELNKHVNQLRDFGVTVPTYVMPVGATKEQQEDSLVIKMIAERAVKEGYHVSGRLHCILWGNGMGV
jgi:organic radical activating enzyme